MESIIVHPKDKHMAAALLAFVEALKMPFEKLNGATGATKKAGGKKKEQADKPYNPEFVAKILESRKQAAEGKVHKIDLKELWK